MERVFGKEVLGEWTVQRSYSVNIYHLFCLSVKTESSHNHQIFHLKTLYNEIIKLLMSVRRFCILSFAEYGLVSVAYSIIS